MGSNNARSEQLRKPDGLLRVRQQARLRLSQHLKCHEVREFIRSEMVGKGDAATKRDTSCGPTPEQIAERIAEVQASWSPEERERRGRGVLPYEVLTHSVSQHRKGFSI